MRFLPMGTGIGSAALAFATCGQLAAWLQGNQTLVNTLLYYTFSSREEPTKTLSLGSNVVLSILSSGKCWILGDQSLLILDSSGVITASYDYEGQYLKMGSLQGDDFAALLLSRSSSGSAGSLRKP